ncbi:hypothetical protein [Chishuiella sp.]|uniref:hypothetical protein n=1 Tax=Chishuiella sp. TaxID=1969467 RepID=UPI0028A985EA|nr:hypothetical protein [Chishuiella sp.]
MKDFFVLTVAIGSILHRADGTSIKLDEVPEEAFEIWKTGTPVLAMKTTGKALVEKLSLKEIQELIKIREPHNYNSELKVLKEVLKSLNSKIRNAK